MREHELFGHEKFVCYWRCGMEDHVTEIHDAGFFTSNNGYSEEDIETLANIHISESVNLSHPTHEHYVMRIW